MTAQDYFNQVYLDARGAEANHVQASIAAAQSAIETGWGKSIKGNSYFGIKAGPSWKGETVDFVTHEVINGKRKKIVDKFRAYDDRKDSVRDHLATIKAKWPDTYNAKTIAEAAKGLDNGVHGRYATDPDYSDKVLVTAKKRAGAARAAFEGMPEQSPGNAEKNPASKILPLYRPKQADDVTRVVLKKFSHLTPEKYRNDPVKVLIVRGYFINSMGRKGENDRAMYDDAVFVASPDGVQAFNGNSDPAVYKSRVATIKAPQAIRYRPGLHGISRGKGYPAFRQDEVCTVVRDGVGDDTGMFYVNLHRGGVNGTSSLGCLTIPPHQWDEFYKLVKGLLDRHKQKTFYVTLLEYGGDNPPVSLPKELSGKTAPAVVGVVSVSVGAIAARYWDQFTTWLGSLF
jgi:hypothetical protein